MLRGKPPGIDGVLRAATKTAKGSSWMQRELSSPLGSQQVSPWVER